MLIDGPSSNRVSWEILQRASRFLGGKNSLLLMAAITLFIAGVAVQRQGYLGWARAELRRLRMLPDRIRALTIRPDDITLDIKYKHFLKIAHKREQSLDDKLLVASPNDFVPATIRHGSDMLPVKLRLKGDLKEHWNTDKWSFRVVVKGARTLFGMKQFSLQRPDARNYLYEWLYHQARAREGLIALQYDFLNVTINGEDRGIYALEEHFEKRLLERHGRREGPIVRFNEDTFWLEALSQGSLSGLPGLPAHAGPGSFLASSIDGFHSSQWLGDATKRAQYIEAIHLLEAFRRGDLTTSEVFDVPQLAMFLALSDLLQAEHSARWRNIRFYYNPITSRLEPIGFDGTQIWEKFRGVIPMMRWDYKDDNFYDLHFYESLFQDLTLYREYVRALEKVSSPGYLETLLADLKEGLQRHEWILRRDYPDYRFLQQPLFNNRRYIHALLHPSKAIHVYLHSIKDDGVTLEVGNLHFLPVEIVSTSLDGDTARQSSTALLMGRNPDQLVAYHQLAVPFDQASRPSQWRPSMIKVRYRLLGTSQIREEASVFPYPSQTDDVTRTLARRPANLDRFSFIRIDESARRVYVRPGAWRVTEDLIVPAGYRLMVEGGTILELTASSSIVSHSPVELRGRSDNAVVVRAVDSVGSGFLVLDAKEPSVLEYVLFDGLSAPQAPTLLITGAVTFYNSPVAIRESRFHNARAEDSLNLIRSRFELFGSFFLNSASDAFDADFCKGEIVNTQFESAVNDAIDVSGSVIAVKQVTIRQAGDKAISAGENSKLSGSGIEVNGAKVAVASKDLSEVKVRQIRITAAEIGFAAFQKKSEYGPGTIHVQHPVLKQVADPYWIEEQSQLTVNHTPIEGKRKNPKPIFYPHD